jgi:hypothetical protein
LDAKLFSWIIIFCRLRHIHSTIESLYISVFFYISVYFSVSLSLLCGLDTGFLWLADRWRLVIIRGSVLRQFNFFSMSHYFLFWTMTYELNLNMLFFDKRTFFLCSLVCQNNNLCQSKHGASSFWLVNSFCSNLSYWFW